MEPLKIQNLVFPGRHHILTSFQHKYIDELLKTRLASDLNGRRLEIQEKPNLIWAVTSANHNNTRRNPLPSNRREQAIEAFCEDLPAEDFTYPINDLGHTERFGDFVIKEIGVQSRGQFSINPDNTVVLCSTPSVIEMYEKLGYPILPVELVDRDQEKYSALRPWDLLLAIVKAGENWHASPIYQEQVHPVSRKLLEKYRLGDLIVEIHNDPLLDEEGDITETRDYQKYRQAFEVGAKRKYEMVRKYIQNGRIVDIGCATGEVIKLLSEDKNLGESDLYGIEASRHLYSICEQRRQNNEFSNDNVFFYQRNIMSSVIFPDNSVNTTTTFSLTHEIESYLGHEALLNFIKRIYDQTALGGIYINSDVVGPDQKDLKIVMKLNDQDGLTESWEQISARPRLDKDQLAALSTLGRFRRFSKDFRAQEGDKLEFRETTEVGDNFIELAMSDACEFLSKKDYLDSWYSEMHERFCFWNFDDWKKAAEKVGFIVNPDSKVYRNDWIVENRYQGRVELFTQESDVLKPLEFPVTNILLIAQKGW